MTKQDPLRIGIACYPTVGGSGVLASALGEELALRGHEVHFFSYERPFRLSEDVPRLHFHCVRVNDYGLFKYPDYTLPLSVTMADVSHRYGLDVLHVHYAVPHATAAILARAMLPADKQPRIVATLHGTDTTLLGRDRGYMAAIRHALTSSDAVTTVSNSLMQETRRLFEIDRSIEVIPNFYSPRPVRRGREDVLRELGVRDELLLFHSSNLRSVKRIDLLLEAVSRIRARGTFKLLVLAGESFAPYEDTVRRLELHDRIIVRTKVNEIEDYLQVADLGVFTSEMESFGLSILEAMTFGCPAVAMRVGGIPELIDDPSTGRLTPFGDVDVFARTVAGLIDDRTTRLALGRAAQRSARERFGAERIVSQYEDLYRRLVAR